MDKQVERDCPVCNSAAFHYLDQPGSGNGRLYPLFKCRHCALWFVHPQPSASELAALYQGKYFEKRTDRGYNDYSSSAVRSSVESTFEKNLFDLGFFEWEKNLPVNKKSLEIGCASGYFVEYIEKKGFDSRGIEISSSMAAAGVNRGLDIQCGNFLLHDYRNEKFDLISMWATIEHLKDPYLFVEKISSLLNKGGHCYISTCNTGFWAKVYGKSWRYLVVPEHLWFFNRKNMELLFSKHGLTMVTSFTYGSGFTADNRYGYLYKACKKMADLVAKKIGGGDIIVCDFLKVR